MTNNAPEIFTPWHDGRRTFDVMMWEFGEGVDSARGVAAIVVFWRKWIMLQNSSQWSRQLLQLFLLLRVQCFTCNCLCEGTSANTFQVRLPRPCPFHRFSKHPNDYVSRFKLCKCRRRAENKNHPKAWCGRLIFYHYWCWRARGAAPVKTSTGNNFPREHQRIPRNYYQYRC